ncbi:MAG TPA: hypothetical protein VL737_03245 [Candidatus Pristimantibacillus sp.]|jgi:hypothetical protein|nr:hypothetical protein [Candidatus Pristimantibacillus sp.]
MRPAWIKPIPKNLTLKLDGKVAIPADTREKIDENWQQLAARNHRLYNGEIFTVTNVDDTDRGTTVTLAETDYAHYLYSRQTGDLGELTVRVIHPAALVVSSDDKFVFGVMAEYTSEPSVIQCCGGGIDNNDVEDGIIDMNVCIARELNEELGVNIQDGKIVEAFYPAYLKSGGPTGKMTAVYILRVKQSGADFMRYYQHFVQGLAARNQEPEFSRLICINSDEQSVEDFIKNSEGNLNDYMAVALRAAQEDLQHQRSKGLVKI